MDSERDTGCSHPVGSPIRTSPDHRLPASPRGFSQLATSFFACLRQGIPTHALSSLTIKFTRNTEQTSYSLRSTPYNHIPFSRRGAFVYARQYSVVKDRMTSFVSHKSAIGASDGSLPTSGGPGSGDQGPRITVRSGLASISWWAWVDSNYRPHPYQGCALAT